MSIHYPGEESPCKLKLCNGFSIEIDYVDKGSFNNFIENYRGRVRRIRLYDADANLLSEMIEENPIAKKEYERVQKIISKHNGPRIEIKEGGVCKNLF